MNKKTILISLTGLAIVAGGFMLSNSSLIGEASLKAKCGNGICSYPENEQNCPVDCLVESDVITWEDTEFKEKVGGDVYNVNEILVDRNGSTVYAAYYDSKNQAYFAKTEDKGESWSYKKLEKIQQVKGLIQLKNGDLMIGTASVNAPILWKSSDKGETWTALSVEGDVILPNEQAQTVWDLIEAENGSIIIATDSLSNDPQVLNTTVYVSKDGGETFEATSPLPGIGVLGLAEDKKGNIYAGIEESSEHNDASLAGQAKIFKTSDYGRTWKETGVLDGANRVYKILVKRDGTLVAGTGILGEVYSSVDFGETWTKLAHVPSARKSTGEIVEASRVYNVFELLDGSIIVGTGNGMGNVYLSRDNGVTWTMTQQPGRHIVVWALDQSKDGTIWVGAGSMGGNIYFYMQK